MNKSLSVLKENDQYHYRSYFIIRLRGWMALHEQSCKIHLQIFCDQQDVPDLQVWMHIWIMKNQKVISFPSCTRDVQVKYKLIKTAHISVQCLITFTTYIDREHWCDYWNCFWQWLIDEASINDERMGMHPLCSLKIILLRTAELIGIKNLIL